MSTRIAIVAGAGSGLGQATALALHAAGYTVVAVDRSESGLHELPDAITHREVADAPVLVRQPGLPEEDVRRAG